MRLTFASIIFAGAALAIFPAHGKEKVLAEPDFEGVYFELQPKSGVLSSLPRETSRQEMRLKALGFGGGKLVVVIPGESCAYQILDKRQPQFIVRVPSQKVDPREYIGFFRVNVSKGNRTIDIVRGGALGSSSRSALESSAIAFDYKLYGQSSVLISPQGQMPPGEYVLGIIGSASAFCFAVR